MVKAYSSACGRDLKHEISPRRPGDVAVVYADPAYAAAELGWALELSPAPSPHLTLNLTLNSPHLASTLALTLTSRSSSPSPPPSPSPSPLTLTRWTAELGLEQMCKDSWNWISNNPDGFDTKA